MADKGSRLAVTRVLAVLLAAVLAVELVPASALAESIAMREEPVVTEAAGDTGEMAAEESAGREAPAPVASLAWRFCSSMSILSRSIRPLLGGRP